MDEKLADRTLLKGRVAFIARARDYKFWAFVQIPWRQARMALGDVLNAETTSLTNYQAAVKEVVSAHMDKWVSTQINEQNYREKAQYFVEQQVAEGLAAVIETQELFDQKHNVKVVRLRQPMELAEQLSAEVSISSERDVTHNVIFPILKPYPD